jgi:hypothetical protein
MRSAWTVLAVVAFALLLVSTVSAGSVLPFPISDDPYTDGGTGHQHKTQVEPDSFAFGQTIVALSQSGRWYGGGGSSNLVFSSSQNGGRTWTTGGLPGTTVNATPPGPWPRISDPSIGYDAQDDVWLALGLGIDSSGDGHILLVNRSTDGGQTWSNPVVAGTAPGTFWDKTWIGCDSWPQSPHYGNCYIEFDDNSAGNLVTMVTSTDGGLTWGSLHSVPGASGLGGQPVALPNGTVVVPYTANYSAVEAAVSTDGGNSWTNHFAASQSSAGDHEMRDPPMPSAEVDSSGRVYVAWSDCRFESGCSANDMVMTTSTDGVAWTPVVRIPTNAVGSGIDHWNAGLGVDRNTGGSSAHLALTYYYFPAGSTDLYVGFTSSLDGGASWTPGTRIAGPMHQQWVAYTNQGYMVGDYISTSFTGDGKAHPAYTLAKPPDSGPNGSCYPNNTGCHQRLTSGTFDITQPPVPPVATRREPIARGLHRHPEDAPLIAPTAN